MPISKNTVTLRSFVVLLASAVVLMILVKGALIARAAFAVREDYQALQTLMEMGMGELLQPSNLGRVDALLSRSEDDLRWLRDEAGPFFVIAPYFGWVPYFGGDIVQAPALLDYGVEAISTARAALSISKNLLQGVSGGSSQGRPVAQVILSALGAIRSDVDALRPRVERIASLRQRIDAVMLSPTLARLVSRGDKALGLALPALQAFDLLPELLGTRGTRQYLFIAQNNDELRATGGFISSAGVIEVQNGKIVQSNFRDSYAIDDMSKQHPKPPQALTDHMWAGVWLFRDANWSPDFPSTARTLEQFYQNDQRVPVDGVIAVNLSAVQRLVTALEPIDVPAYGEQVTGKNFLERMEYYFVSPEGVGQTGDWWLHRKDFMGALMQASVTRLNGEKELLNLPRVAQSLWEGLAAKDILIYLNDPQSARLLYDLRWDGALPNAPRDALLVVDSNVGFNKVDRRIERQFDYRVEIQPGKRARASVRIRYRNQNPPSNQPCVHAPMYKATYDAMRDNCYWDYVRVYIPPNSTAISSTADISPAIESPEAGYTVLSGAFVLPRGETREVQFDYWLPPDWIRSDSPSEYTLTWIKQPGTDPAQVRVVLIIPASLQVLGAFPPPTSRTNSGLEYILPPDRDATIVVRVAPADRIGEATILVLAILAVALIAFLLIQLLFRRKR